MEKLLELAKRRADSAEVFMQTYEENSIGFENYTLSEIKNKIQTGYCLRVIKNGKIGMSYTKNLLDRDALVTNALESLKGEVQADFFFPEKHTAEALNVFDPEIATLSSQKVMNTTKEIADFVKGKTAGQLNIYSGYGTSKTRIINSNGLNVESRDSYHYNYPMLMYPGTYASIANMSMSKSFNPIDQQLLKNIIDRYEKGLPQISPDAGDIQVIFTPSSLYCLIWRLRTAANAKNLYEKISPLENKIGERIFSEKLTIYDDPRNPQNVGARTFDDEGVPSDKLVLVENGVFKSFFNDLNYAAKLKMKPTGNGYKDDAWGGETIAAKPAPTLVRPTIAPGDVPLEAMIKGIKRGVLLHGMLGAHSGNIINGDFSVGINPGLYIENGEIIGRVKDGMIAGNIYDVMKRVSAVENKNYYVGSGRYPHICFDDVKLSK